VRGSGLGWVGFGADSARLTLALLLDRPSLDRPSRVGVVEMGGRRVTNCWFGEGVDLVWTRGGDNVGLAIDGCDDSGRSLKFRTHV
jgi:hypothetical protein